MISSQEEVVEFIHRRFPLDSHWLDGNCYYFALILHDRFPDLRIYYDTVWGHFVVGDGTHFYDWTGECQDGYVYILWDEMEKFDEAQYKRIVKYCIE